MAKFVNAWNEWDPLKRVILGSPIGTCQPKSDVSWDYESPSRPGFYGPLPKEMEDRLSYIDYLLLLLQDEIISERYENGSIIITSNQPITNWDQLFNGPAVSSALCLSWPHVGNL